MRTPLAWALTPVARDLLDLQADWPDWERWPNRARWLHDFEAVLRRQFPQASSDELTLTARLAAPFPLALPGVP